MVGMANRYVVKTDLEGVLGVDEWKQIRHVDDDFDEAAESRAKSELAREVNACVAGIRQTDPDAAVDVLDGHGRGGLRERDLEDATYRRRPDQSLFEEHDYAAQLYVGQHAMAGTAFAPLRHTQSSISVEYYRLNGTFIGEFAGGAIEAGTYDVPTVFLAGDDKACQEATVFVPEIETTPVKYGFGEEAAEHRERSTVLEEIQERSARAVERRDEIAPLTGFDSPYTMEIRYQSAQDGVRERYRTSGADTTQIDPYTVRIESNDFDDVYP
jgi:D-amino peptidase